MINYLDPTGELIQYRLYQSDCIATAEGAYVKDLRILNRNIERVVMIDNSVWSFAAQLDNGIPILPWTGDPEDKELRELAAYLGKLSLAEDVRAVNRETFKLQSILARDN